MDYNTVCIDQNVVVLARNFNVALMTPIWLYKNQIFSENELKEATCLPVTIEIKSDEFTFILLPDRLQFSLAPQNENAKELISSKIGKIIGLLPHTPFVAAGLNFTYHITPTTGDMHTLSRSLFCNEKSSLFNYFDSKDARFGGYFSKDVIGARLGLDVKPIPVKKDSNAEERLQFSFNFNITIGQDNNISEIQELFGKWDVAKSISSDIAGKLNQED